MNCGTLCQKRAANALCAHTLAVLIAMGTAACGRPAADGSQSDSAVSAFSAQTGDAAVDPENAEIVGESGVGVRAADLPAQTGRSNGIDVSKWQGKIDWQQVKAGGIEFAMIRIGYRGENGVIYKDDNADYNIQQAQKAGVPVGVYFFSTAVNEQEAAEEAQWTVRAVEGYSISYPVVYDCEGFRRAESRMYALTAAQRTTNAQAFLRTAAQAGYDAMLYGARSELENALYWEIAQLERDYKIWLAQYPDVTYPQLARPDYGGRCDAWQYTDCGSVPGIEGNVDLTVCYFTADAAAPKNAAAAPGEAAAPLTEEEKSYTAVNDQVTAKDTVNLRTAATTKSGLAGVLKNGETLPRVGIGANGWSKLVYNGRTVYAITSYLTTDLSFTAPREDVVAGNTFTPQNDRVTAKNEVNLRAIPSTDGEILGVLKSGEFLERTAVSNRGWSRLVYGGQTVYAVTSYLTDTPVSQPETPAVPDDGFAPADGLVTAKSETNLRTAPSTDNSQVVYTLPNGEYVQRVGIHPNGWSKLIYNGQTVYAITSYLTE